MVERNKNGLAKGGAGICVFGGMLTIIGMLLTFWGPSRTNIFSENLISIAQSAKFWYLYVIPILGIVSMATGCASYVSGSRGAGIAVGLLGFLIFLICLLYSFHATYLAGGGKDIFAYIGKIIPQLRIGWYLTAFGGFLCILGGMFLSSAFKVRVDDEPDEPEERMHAPPRRRTAPVPRPVPEQYPSTQSAVLKIETEAIEEDVDVEEEIEPPEEEHEELTAPPPPEESLPPPKDDIPSPYAAAAAPSAQSDDTDEDIPPPKMDEDDENDDFRIEKGYNHLILEDTPAKAFRALKDLTWDDTKGMCLSTAFPSKLDKEYGLNAVEKIWISHSTSNEFTTIDPKRLDFEITRAISNFMKEKSGGVILIDGLEYLIVENGFENVLKFLKKIGDLSSVNNSTLIISVNPSSLSIDQLTILKKDFDKVHILKSGSKPQ